MAFSIVLGKATERPVCYSNDNCLGYLDFWWNQLFV